MVEKLDLSLLSINRLISKFRGCTSLRFQVTNFFMRPYNIVAFHSLNSGGMGKKVKFSRPIFPLIHMYRSLARTQAF